MKTALYPFGERHRPDSFQQAVVRKGSASIRVWDFSTDQDLQPLSGARFSRIVGAKHALP